MRISDLPRVSWLDFLEAAPYFTSLVHDVIDPERPQDAPPALRAAYYFDLFDGQVSNGGVMQYFYNLAHSVPAFARAPEFVAELPCLAPVLPFMREVHAAWDSVADAVRGARDDGDWPEDLFNEHGERFEALENAFYAINHRISQSLCAEMVRDPHAFFNIEPVDVPAKGVAHLTLRGGTRHLRFENGFPIGPNLLEQRNGDCDVVWFSRDRQLMTSHSGSNRHWIHYPSQVSGSWHFFDEQGLRSYEASTSLWHSHGLYQWFHAEGTLSSATLSLDGKEQGREGFYPDGTCEMRCIQQGESELQRRYWPNGQLSTECIQDKHGHVRTLRCLAREGRDLTPGGNGAWVECLGLDDNGWLLWREGTLVNGFVEGEVRWLRSRPDGSEVSVQSSAQFVRGAENVGAGRTRGKRL